MLSDHSSVHHTEINRIDNPEQGGWEFVCHSCGYRARYTVDSQGTQKLEILFVGDTSARHASGMAPANEVDMQSTFPIYDPLEEELDTLEYSSQTPLDDLDLGQEHLLAGDDWLPLELQEQVEAILQKFD